MKFVITNVRSCYFMLENKIYTYIERRAGREKDGRETEVISSTIPALGTTGLSSACHHVAQRQGA